MDIARTNDGDLIKQGVAVTNRRGFLRGLVGIAAALNISRDIEAISLGQAQKRPSGRTGSRPEMIEIPEYMTYASLPDGRVIGICGSPRDGHAVARYSSDQGGTWSTPVVLFPIDTSLGAWSFQNCLLDRDGELQIIGSNDANTTKHSQSLYDIRYDIWHFRSRDRRRSWNPPVMAWKGYAGSLLSFLQLRDGRVVVPFCYLTHRSWAARGRDFDNFTYMGRFSSSAICSDDNGQTWQVSPNELKEPTPQIGDDGGIEPIVLELESGRLLMLIRTQNGHFFESFSQDRGATWSKPLPTGIKSSDSPCSLTRLPDGRVVMFWNNTLRYPYANGGRAVLHGAISEDDGKTWRGYREIAANPLAVEPPPPNGDHGVTYTVPALTAGGRLITSLSTGPGGGTYILRVDPEWFYETAQSCNFSEGLKGWSCFGTRGVDIDTHPDNQDRRILALRKPDPEWPAGATWNFPAGKRGRLRIRLKLEPGFSGAVIGITDHFSVPFDEQDRYHNVFTLDIGSGGVLPEGARIDSGRWQELVLAWDCERERKCSVNVNASVVAWLPSQRESCGPSYLRIRSTALEKDLGGLRVESVDVDVSSSWTA